MPATDRISDPQPPERRVRSRAFRRRARALRKQALQAAARARRKLLILVPLLAILVVVYVFRRELFGVDKPIRLAVACAMIAIGWSLARNLGRAVQPRLALEFDPASAGVAGFLVRLLTLIAIALVSLRIAGLQPGALALGATFTAVIVGLAAQQTFGNVFAGVVLLSARPFQVGDRVRFNGFGMDVEGTVAEHGLLYVTLTDGEDVVMIPNSTALTMSVRPLRQPAAIDLRARLPLGIDPPTIERRIAEAVTVPIKEDSPHVALEEVDGDEVAVRIQATPADSRKGGELAREILDAVIELRREGGGRDARPRSDSIAAARS